MESSGWRFCLSNALAGRDGPPDEQRCTRVCDNEGTLDQSLCACGTSLCIDIETTITDDVSGVAVGQHFCTPCDANRGTCNPSDPNCCDPSADCFDGIVTDLGESADMCCRGADVACDSAPDACCPGTRCDGAACQRCAREGEDPSIGCCEGFTEFLAANGTECMRCALGGFTCSDEHLQVFSSTGEVTTVTIPETEAEWWRDQPGAGGDIVTTGNATEVVYDLTDQHRAYLFPHSLSMPPPFTNYSALLLPTGSTRVPIPSSVEVPTSNIGELTIADTATPVTWGGVRVYDVGACSQLIRWPLLVNLLALETNKALDDLGGNG